MTAPNDTAAPGQLTCGCERSASARMPSKTRYPASTAKHPAITCCARRSAASLWLRTPPNRQITALAEASSISESRPNPNSATAPATSAAMIATAASSTIHPILSHDSTLARRTRRERSTVASR
ncbi:MAG: hypothetical protein WBP81_32590 [Solirubrobacteraceae bacterium]